MNWFLHYSQTSLIFKTLRSIEGLLIYGTPFMDCGIKNTYFNLQINKKKKKQKTNKTKK